MNISDVYVLLKDKKNIINFSENILRYRFDVLIWYYVNRSKIIDCEIKDFKILRKLEIEDDFMKSGILEKLPLVEVLLLAMSYLTAIVAIKNEKTYEDILNEHEALVMYKNQQYGDIIQNPKCYFINPDETETIVRGLINNKINRILHQTDNEDAYCDLLGYMIHLTLLRW